jgi:hypothetical protein
MSVEQLFFLAAVVLIALFNFIRQILAQRRQPGDAPEEVPAAAEKTTGRPPAVPARLARLEPRRTLPSPAPPAPPERPRRSGRLFADRRDARRGIVLVTVLGPCRGIESPSAPTGDIYSATLPR